ncbi:hypothetical protein [Sagittula sp.]|uniref:hypothetical protein n=1 Tax=Sagittula sp. TaxID=2038081 RepID=UPI0035187B79
MSLLDLVSQSRTVKLSGGSVEVHAMRWRDILGVIGKHVGIAKGIQALPAEKRIEGIRDVVLGAGADALDDLIDCATKHEPGTAASAPLTAIDEAEIVTTLLDISLSRDRLGKVWAEGEKWFAALGPDSKD